MDRNHQTVSHTNLRYFINTFVVLIPNLFYSLVNIAFVLKQHVQAIVNVQK